MDIMNRFVFPAEITEGGDGLYGFKELYSASGELLEFIDGRHVNSDDPMAATLIVPGMDYVGALPPGTRGLMMAFPTVGKHMYVFTPFILPGTPVFTVGKHNGSALTIWSPIGTVLFAEAGEYVDHGGGTFKPIVGKVGFARTSAAGTTATVLGDVWTLAVKYDQPPSGEGGGTPPQTVGSTTEIYFKNSTTAQWHTTVSGNAGLGKSITLEVVVVGIPTVLSDLTDVTSSAGSTGDLLFYKDSTDKWTSTANGGITAGVVAYWSGASSKWMWSTTPATGSLYWWNGTLLAATGAPTAAGTLAYWDGTSWQMLAPPASDGKNYFLKCNNGVLAWMEGGACP